MTATIPNEENLKPSLKNLTHDFGKPNENFNKITHMLGEPHVQSFNSFLNSGLTRIVDDIPSVHITLPNEDEIQLFLKNPIILSPQCQDAITPAVYPTECRQSHSTYMGELKVELHSSVNGNPQPLLDISLGCIPIMVKSSKCHLYNLGPKDLIEHQEREDEWGGYFVIKGKEKIIRMLLITRRNYPIAISRNSWKMRGAQFSDKGVLIRCVSEDETSVNNVLHYALDGSAKLMFAHNSVMYFVPIMLILKALLDFTGEAGDHSCDFYIYKQLIKGNKDSYFKRRIKCMLQILLQEGIYTHKDAKKYIGKMFRSRIYELKDNSTDEEICDFVLRKCIAIHLKNNRDKFNLLVYMTQKLFLYARDEISAESVDSIVSQEVLLGGHLFQQVLKAKLVSWLRSLRSHLMRRVTSDKLLDFHASLSKAAKSAGEIEGPMENFLATGNLPTYASINLTQDKGLVIVAENINRMRYMSHFRSVHRGTFFQEMRTTTVRKLLPDTWGFICPIHTPDGAPCGLLTHLSKYCEITQEANPQLVANIPAVLVSMGMVPIDSPGSDFIRYDEMYVVMLDGCILGYISRESAQMVVNNLRVLKIQGTVIPKYLEIGFIPALKKWKTPQPSGLFMFTTPARLMRPVINLAAGNVEYIGTMEQLYLDICVNSKEAYPGITTHKELSLTSIFSNEACLIPLPDCNPSPRNMYQCQMGKQTMGTPCLNYGIQAEKKLYRLHTPTSPLFRPSFHDLLELDNYGMGTNSIVAVISYTGYDMEDAMVINKASYERGIMHGTLYKSVVVDLTSSKSYFGRNPVNDDKTLHLGTDGLPFPGQILRNGDVICSYFCYEENIFKNERYTGAEEVVVDNVRLCGSGNLGTKSKSKACVTMRVKRNPEIGDKFASRAGQKGICSMFWPVEDLPFSETGIVPDILFNPHGFPSRMTIAMMIEMMAGKSAALEGTVYDATPFKFGEENPAYHYFGQALEEAGFNYYGNERMYSGTLGCEFEAQIFLGVVHYQRLRHMVSDKWQVRSTGVVDAVTHQPIKGRRRGGGVRFGEMERDALLAHGTSFLLQDRLFECSDRSKAWVCRKCCNILSSVDVRSERSRVENCTPKCVFCKESTNVVEYPVPHVFRLFVSQLASVNINVKIHLKGV